MKILIGTSLLTSVDANVYANHMALYYHLGRIAEKRGWQFFTITPTRMSIDRMRNEAAKLALQLECDYLVFIDDDMLLNVETVEKLIDADKDIIMAHTYIRGYPFDLMSFKRGESGDPADIALKHQTEKDLEESEGDLCECDAIGFATVAIKSHLLKNLTPPWFITGPNGTEDIYFCLRCKTELDEPTGIYVHKGVPTAHKLDPEFVAADNVERLRTYYAPKTPVVEDKRGDRGTEYHETIKNLDLAIGDELSFGDKL